MSERIPILEKNLMIIASAGSGKTYQLGNRVIGLIGARGVEPERIVALTFTRKAAGEFADSVLTKLAAAAGDETAAATLREDVGEPLDAAETLGRVVRALPRFQLGTLDSFFGRVVRGFQYELGLSGGKFELIEGPKLEAALADILGDLLGEALGGEEGDEFLHAFKRATAGKEDVRVGQQLQRFFKNWHGLWKEMPSAGVFGRAGAFGALPGISEWGKGKDDLLDRLARAAAGIAWTDKRQPKAMDKLIGALRGHTVASGSLNSTSGLFPQVIDWLADGGASGMTLKNYKEFPPGPMAEDLLRETISLMAGCELSAAVGRTQAVAKLVGRYDAECARRLRRRGQLGFEDVKVLMGEWARSETARLRREAVDFRLDGRYEHWLLDEFQDTSQSDWTGVVTLLDEAAMDGQMGSLFIVGDPKQAIYGWRGGDVRLFDEVRRRYARGMDEVTMPESWRSCPQVLDLVNQVCGNLTVIREIFGPVADRWPWEDHQSARPGVTGEARVEMVAGKAEERADRLVGLLKGELGLGRRALSCGVLVRTNEQVRDISERLRAEGFDVIEEGSRRPTGDNPVGVAMFHLLRWLADPRDRFARELVAMSPLWGKESISGRFGEAWQAAWEGLLAEAHADGFAAMMERMVEPMWGGFSEFGRRRAGDVIDALAEFDAMGGGTAREAVRWLDGLEVSQSPGVAAVQVMTIHKAKGLGFDVVVLPEIEDRQVPSSTHFTVASGGEGGSAWLLQPPAKWARQVIPELAAAEERWAETQKYEALCVLYVALTRAKRGLYVLLPEPPKTRKNSGTWASPANWIARALGADGSGMAEDAGDSGAVLFQSGDSSWLDGVPERAGAETQPESPCLGEARPLRKRSTPSGEKKVGGAAHAVAPSFSGMAFGSRVHALFERIEWIEGDLPDPGDGEEAELVRECLGIEEIAELFRKCGKTQVFREQPFEVILDGAWISGVIDRLLVERDAEGRPVSATVVDFKTDRVESAGELAERYRGQIETYRHSVARALGLDPGSVRGIFVSTALKTAVPV